MICYVYVLGSNGTGGHRTYVGWTLDLERRLLQHNSGRGARSTRGRTWILLHSEIFQTRNEAMSREWHLKRDRAFRKKLAQNYGEPDRSEMPVKPGFSSGNTKALKADPTKSRVD